MGNLVLRTFNFFSHANPKKTADRCYDSASGAVTVDKMPSSTKQGRSLRSSAKAPMEEEAEQSEAMNRAINEQRQARQSIQMNNDDRNIQTSRLINTDDSGKSTTSKPLCEMALPVNVRNPRSTKARKRKTKTSGPTKHSRVTEHPLSTYQNQRRSPRFFSKTEQEENMDIAQRDERPHKLNEPAAQLTRRKRSYNQMNSSLTTMEANVCGEQRGSSAIGTTSSISKRQMASTQTFPGANAKKKTSPAKKKTSPSKEKKRLECSSDSSKSSSNESTSSTRQHLPKGRPVKRHLLRNFHSEEKPPKRAVNRKRPSGTIQRQNNTSKFSNSKMRKRKKTTPKSHNTGAHASHTKQSPPQAIAKAFKRRYFRRSTNSRGTSRRKRRHTNGTRVTETPSSTPPQKRRRSERSTNLKAGKESNCAFAQTDSTCLSKPSRNLVKNSRSRYHLRSNASNEVLAEILIASDPGNRVRSLRSSAAANIKKESKRISRSIETINPPKGKTGCNKPKELSTANRRQKTPRDCVKKTSGRSDIEKGQALSATKGNERTLPLSVKQIKKEADVLSIVVLDDSVEATAEKLPCSVVEKDIQGVDGKRSSCLQNETDVEAEDKRKDKEADSLSSAASEPSAGEAKAQELNFTGENGAKRTMPLSPECEDNMLASSLKCVETETDYQRVDVQRGSYLQNQSNPNTESNSPKRLVLHFVGKGTASERRNSREDRDRDRCIEANPNSQDKHANDTDAGSVSMNKSTGCVSKNEAPFVQVNHVKKDSLLEDGKASGLEIQSSENGQKTEETRQVLPYTYQGQSGVPTRHQYMRTSLVVIAQDSPQN